jgi:putative inorganic carbon (hco3(-)) transporter
MEFILFILVNATLFIRPAEVVPALTGLPIYNVLISICLMASFPRIFDQLTGRSLFESPISACVLGLLAAVMLSHLSHLNFSGLLEGGSEFAKIILYYLLMVSVVDSPARLRRFLWLLVGFTVVLTVLALLQYHDLIDVPSLQSVGDQEVDAATGEEYTVLRLCSTGIYNDPNDLCLILLVTMGICLYGLGDRRAGPLRYLWLAPLVLFGYALTKTHSRGGFLALLAAMMVLFHARFGWRKAIPLAMVALPAAFVLFAGRQTNISTSDDTGQDRIQLWAQGFALLRQSPLFGIGQNRYAEEVGLVAHNSFIHGFTELGVFGGSLFTGIFYCALSALHRLGPSQMLIPDPELRRLRPYLMAIVAAYAAGLLTISRNYIVPTYMIFGLVNVYLRLATEGSPLRPPRFDLGFVQRLGTISVVFIITAYFFVRTFARFGG